MFKTFANALKIKDIRTKLLYTFLCLIIVRIGCMLPVPGINRTYFANWLSNVTQGGGLGFLDVLTGGSFSQMSIFALNISPYITSSIIMQLLTIAIPKLEEMQKDGETGRKKIAEITRYVTIGLAIFESVAMGIGFKNSNVLESGNAWLHIAVITLSFTAGSAFLMWLGEQITEKGIGNGISVILLINIVDTLPGDYTGLYEQFVKGQSVAKAVIAAVVIVAVTIALVVLIILLQDAQRRISVQYAKKMQGRRMVGGQSSFIPLRINTAGVIPVIFAVSLLQTPIIISSLFGVTGSPTGNVWQKILMYLNQRNWCKFTTEGYGIYTLGLILYIAMLFFFAYFYTGITFNPAEVSNNLKKQGGFIPGIRPGKPTSDYLTRILNYIIFIGAVGLVIVAMIPIFFNGAFNANVSFGGTSLIIIVGVILETLKQIESKMVVRNYKGFLS
ncbi:MAG TPA: preprotein translocase subunit SecY [Lachnospiraceae bacterium]|nr:preprotein translocase subunit SecY [Lachnospiraceae bacterium]